MNQRLVKPPISQDRAKHQHTGDETCSEAVQMQYRCIIFIVAQ